MKNIIVGFFGLVAVIYLLNPGAGLFEMIPDNLPFIGNLDEVAAVGLLIMCLKYFGFDLANIFSRDKKPSK